MVVQNSEKWLKIVELYNRTKTLTIKAEEISKGHESFVAPIIQHRDTLDHLVRVVTAELNIQEFSAEKGKSDYIKANLDKALGHQYRAFFDAADFLGILFREEIEAVQKRFSIEAIANVLPDYFSVTLPKIIKFSKEIEAIRKRKDIGDGPQLLQIANDYTQVLKELDKDHEKVIIAQPSLGAFEKKRKSQKTLKIVLTILGSLALAIVSALFGAWLNSYFQ